MTIKKYRLCLVMVLIAVLLLGAVLFMKNTEEDNTYKDGIMVYRECVCSGEEYL